VLYVFDSSSFIHIGYFLPDRFPTFWRQFDALVMNEQVVSVREAWSELDTESAMPHLFSWLEKNKEIFATASADEALVVAEIFKVPRFLELIKQRNLSRGMPVADPFLVAAAKVLGGCLVTEEREKPNAAKIPNVCKHFNVDCTNVEGFMTREGMRY
jgi:hypothetical protein